MCGKKGGGWLNRGRNGLKGMWEEGRRVVEHRRNGLSGIWEGGRVVEQEWERTEGRRTEVFLSLERKSD